MDPQRPYAQLLTPIARSIKLLRRAQHHKVVDKEQFAKHEAILQVWQKLSAKGIPACPASFMTDLFIFPENGAYLGVIVENKRASTILISLHQLEILDGLICVHTKGKLLKAEGNFISLHPSIFDFLNVGLLQLLAKGLSVSQARAVSASTFDSIGIAVQFLQLLGHGFPQIAWEGFSDADINEMVHMLTTLYRNQEQYLRVDKLTKFGKLDDTFKHLCQLPCLTVCEREGNLYVKWCR